MGKVSRKAKRRFMLLSICIFGVLGYLVFSCTGYWTKISENKESVASLTLQYNELLENEKALKSEVTKLQDPDYVARYASEKFLVSKEGMTIIRIIN